VYAPHAVQLTPWTATPCARDGARASGASLPHPITVSQPAFARGRGAKNAPSPPDWLVVASRVLTSRPTFLSSSEVPAALLHESPAAHVLGHHCALHDAWIDSAEQRPPAPGKGTMGGGPSPRSARCPRDSRVVGVWACARRRGRGRRLNFSRRVRHTEHARRPILRLGLACSSSVLGTSYQIWCRRCPTPALRYHI
jgi:hypothetical protein